MTNKNTFNIWVYGAGAVGCYYGARLIQAGQNVLFIARGEHLEALKNNGLKVLSYRGEFELNPIQACSEEELDQQFAPDIVMVCTKTYSNLAVAERLKRVLKKNVPLFIFQNGIKSQEIFKKFFPPEFVSRTIINVAAALKEPGVLLHSAGELVTVPETGFMAAEFIELFKGVGVNSRLVDNIEREAWSKTAWNAAFNSVTALTRLTTKPILDDNDGHLLIVNICEEVYKLAKANNIDLPSDLAAQKIHYTQEKLGDISTSTLEAVKNKKKIEYEAILGDLIEEADRLKMEVPHLKTIFTLLKLLDKSNAS